VRKKGVASDDSEVYTATWPRRIFWYSFGFYYLGLKLINLFIILKITYLAAIELVREFIKNLGFLSYV
jgi:hypothetical protein